MSEGIPYADIVILALVAGFILLRLRSILGQNHGIDFSQRPPQERPQKEPHPVVQLDKRPAKPKEEPDAYLLKLGDAPPADGLKQIRQKDPQFSATDFLDGARRAFEMVFDAFVKEDKSTLKLLLSEELYDDFGRELESRSKEENRRETTLVSIRSGEITQAVLTGNLARITVKFTSEQVTVERNAAGDIVAGDPSQVSHVEDEWVFERDVTSKSPNWKIIET